jgi:hypothetical protein
MNSLREAGVRHSIVKDVAVAAMRAVGSIMVVGGVALGVAAIRDGGISWPKVARMFVLNQMIFVVIFLFLGVWEFWYRRAKRHHTL